MQSLALNTLTLIPYHYARHRQLGVFSFSLGKKVKAHSIRVRVRVRVSVRVRLPLVRSSPIRVRIYQIRNESSFVSCCTSVALNLIPIRGSCSTDPFKPGPMAIGASFGMSNPKPNPRWGGNPGRTLRGERGRIVYQDDETLGDAERSPSRDATRVPLHRMIFFRSSI